MRVIVNSILGQFIAIITAESYHYYIVVCARGGARVVAGWNLQSQLAAES